MQNLTSEAIELLKQLIEIPSLSRNESNTATFLYNYLHSQGIDVKRHNNNIWAFTKLYDAAKPTLLLNAHHDTVSPSTAYTRNPFSAIIENGKIYGLGSNDDGASLAGLLLTFLHYKDKALPFNLLLALSAEEEVTGINGIRSLVKLWKENNINLSWGIVGEPTGMNVAIGERGLVVLDCKISAKGGHAAREEGENALYWAIDDINRLRKLTFPRISKLLGTPKITVTQIEAGRQHNVLPEVCKFVVDVRTTDALTNEETIEFIKANIKSEAIPRSTHICPSAISSNHPLVKAAVKAGARIFVSPTTSDQTALPNVETIKIGIGESSRSHTSDEYVEISEIEHGIERYIQIVKNFADETLG